MADWVEQGAVQGSANKHWSSVNVLGDFDTAGRLVAPLDSLQNHGPSVKLRAVEPQHDSFGWHVMWIKEGLWLLADSQERQMDHQE